MSSSHPHTKLKGVVIDNAAFSRNVHQDNPTVHNKNYLVSLLFHELSALLTYFWFGSHSSATSYSDQTRDLFKILQRSSVHFL